MVMYKWNQLKLTKFLLRKTVELVLQFIFFFLPISVSAIDIPTDSVLNEEIVFIKKKQIFPIDLETTIFKPAGSGPFPIVVINHGKQGGSERTQPRERPLPAVREFLKRGYAVVVPMRQGFSNSGGSVLTPGCNITSNGIEQAKDLNPILEWLSQQKWADTKNMIMMGQSHGGLTTLAYAQNPYPGFKLFVNFAGGLKFFGGNCLWEQSLKQALKSYGQNTSATVLWFYGENDSLFPPVVIKPAFDEYKKGNPNVEMIVFGPFGKDAHGMFGSYEGIPIWLPVLEKKMVDLNLPTEVIYPQFTRPKDISPPHASGFALIDEIDKVPLKNIKAKEGYKEWLKAPSPKAFAVHPTNGSWGSSWGGEIPYSRSLTSCEKFAKAPCKLYAVDDRVVWDPQHHSTTSQ
jgi:dienelactone hydrolase